MNRGFFRSRRGRGRGEGFALLLLLSELMRNWEYLPIVTLSTIIGQILIYLKLLTFLPWTQKTSSVCVSLYKIFTEKDYSKIFISQIEHADDWHLYYNMVSFMNKSKSLEQKFGTVKYILLLILFTICTGLTYLGLNYCLLEITQDESYLYRCAVGFSGVIFAMKVLTTHYWPHDHGRTFHLMGMPLFSTGNISSKYVVWIELGLISLISPNASFIGHLAGILVGMAFTYGPLQLVLDVFYDIVASVLRFGGFSERQRFHQTSFSSGYSTSTSAPSGSTSSTRRRNYQSTYSPDTMSEEEQIRRATEESLRENYREENPPRHYGFESFSRQQFDTHQPSAPLGEDQPHSTSTLSQEELRQRRLRRFT